MNENKIRKIGAIIVCLILMVMLIIVLVRTFGKILYNLNIKNDITILLADKEMEEENINIDWKEKYPIERVNQNEKVSIIKKVKSKIEKIETEIENSTSKELLGYEKFVEKSYLYDKFIKYSLVSNTDRNARIKVGDYWCKSEIFIDTRSQSERLKLFNKYLKDKNINLLYVQAPNKIEKNNDYISKIYYDCATQNMDKFLSYIDGEINYLDLRNNIAKKGEEYLQLFFNTDYHWKPETGIWAAGEVSNILNTEYNYTINTEIISNIKNYAIHTYEGEFLGADGRYVTLTNTHPDDISIIIPKFETELIVKIPEKVPYKSGNFEETLIDWSKLNKNYIYNSNQYAAYGYGNTAIIEIENLKSENDNRLLVIKDSFANVVVPYLSLEIGSTSIIDLRYFDGSLKSYIDEYKPDTILMLYSPDSLGTGRMWTYE